MTFNNFKKDFITFLEESKVNLGRKTSKTRSKFLNEAEAKINAIKSQFSGTKKQKQPSVDGSMDDRLVRIKPGNSQKALNIGKGVHAMTSTESGRADEQLGRSPYQGKDE